MWDYPPLLLLLLPLLHLLPGVLGQFEEEEKPYRGQLVGSLNSYHHQVSLGSATQSILLNQPNCKLSCSTSSHESEGSWGALKQALGDAPPPHYWGGRKAICSI